MTPEPANDDPRARMPRADFLTSIVLIVLGVGMLWGALEMPRFEQRNVPAILAVIMLLLALLLLGRACRQGGYRLAAGDQPASSIVFSASSLTMLLTLALGLIYAIGLVGSLPFWAATLIFVTVFILIFEWPLARPGRRWLLLLTAALQGAAVAAAVTLVFQDIFLVTLP
jgi:hypothetical protein